MSHIQLTGNLSMVSTNGDGPQMLTEAAEFLNALAQMGVLMAVEINLRPLVEEAMAAKPSTPDPAPVDPTPAAPSTTDTPPTPAQRPPYPIGELENGTLTWRKLSKDQRRRAAAIILRYMQAPTGGGGMPQREYDETKPQWMPNSTGLWNLFDKMGWVEMLKRAWDQSLT